jgi:HEPN domain-containing protein
MTTTPIFRRDFRLLAELRVNEAQTLLKGRKVCGAYYLAGYAVECALKACIAKKIKRYQFPTKKVERIYTHNLSDLMSEAGLQAELEIEIKRNTGFARNWSTVKEWTEESRYKSAGLNGKDMYNAVIGADGVLQWIKQRW